MDVSQADRNVGTAAQGLVLASGLVTLVAGATWFNLLAASASAVLYFRHKGRSRFVVRHLKQAAGWQVGLLLVSLVVSLTLPSVAEAALKQWGGPVGMLWLLQFVGTGTSLATVGVGMRAMDKAWRGEPYVYPVVGRWLIRLNF